MGFPTFQFSFRLILGLESTVLCILQIISAPCCSLISVAYHKDIKTNISWFFNEMNLKKNITSKRLFDKKCTKKQNKTLGNSFHNMSRFLIRCFRTRKCQSISVHNYNYKYKKLLLMFKFNNLNINWTESSLKPIYKVYDRISGAIDRSKNDFNGSMFGVAVQ